MFGFGAVRGGKSALNCLEIANHIKKEIECKHTQIICNVYRINNIPVILLKNGNVQKNVAVFPRCNLSKNISMWNYNLLSNRNNFICMYEEEVEVSVCAKATISNYVYHITLIPSYLLCPDKKKSKFYDNLTDFSLLVPEYGIPYFETNVVNKLNPYYQNIFIEELLSFRR
jgi:hypothetical protein